MPAMSTSRPPRRGVPPSVAAAFALAFAFAASAVFVAVEAAPMEGLHSPSHSMEDCPSYGCVMLPRDVAFDEHAKAALESIRALATAAAAADEDAEEGAEGGGDAEEGNEVEEANDEAAGDEHKGYASSSAAAFEGLVSAGNDEAATLTLIGYKGGTMESQINQDRSFVLSPYVLGGSSNPQEGSDIDGTSATTTTARLLGVFDGHAKLGELVSQHSVEELPGLLAAKLASALDGDGDDDDGASIEEATKKVLVETFVEVDKSAPAQDGGGCTASVVLQLDDDVYLANAGDSRSFLAAYIPPSAEDSGSDEGNAADDDGEVGTVQVLYATREDKPHLPDEKERIESMGGTVMVPSPERLAAGATSRVMYVDPATGGQYGLAMSRSIGDWEVGRYGVVPMPIVEKFNLGEMAEEAAKQAAEMACAPPDAAEAEVDESGEPVVSSTEKKGECSSEPIDPSSVRLFAVSATDGLLDYVPLDLIAQHVARGLYGPSELHPLTACEDLVATAAGGWHRAKGGRYRDDIAIAVSRLDLERR